MGLSDNRTHRNACLNFMIFMLALCVILLIVACCGMSTMASTLRGASWASTVNEDHAVFVSFYGICSEPPEFIFPERDIPENETIFCKAWEDFTPCLDENFDKASGFYQTVCRTKGLKNWLGFCIIVSFFLTLVFTTFVAFRRIADSPKRKRGAVVFGWLSWTFLLFTFATFSVNCIPRGLTPVPGSTADNGQAVYMVPGPGMGATITVWFFLLIFVPVNMMMAPQSVGHRARYMPRETTHVSGMP